MFTQTHLRRPHNASKSNRPQASLHQSSTENEGVSESSTASMSASAPPASNPASPIRPRTTSSAISETVSNFSDISFNPFSLSRTSSIYTLGRTSFAAQLNQLVCVDLPDPAALEASVSAIPTATEACRVLSGAAPQIKRWIDTAAQILGGLDTEDDIEVVSSGDESVQEVDRAVAKFAELINVYVGAIDGLQKRSDVKTVPSSQVKDVVNTLEALLGPWDQVKKSLADAKSNVKLAKEWEELWNTYMGEIRNELNDLERLIFQLEEKRHLSSTDKPQEDAALFAMDESLTPIAEDPEANGHSRDLSPSGPVPSFTLTSPLATAHAAKASEDSGLLALFARMQPVQASLSFLPIRLASFKSRARLLFPTACQELDDRRKGLEEQWQKLEKNAETLRDELSEDRWIDVFRNAGRQATKMCQSVEHGIKKLNEAILITNNQGSSANVLAKRVADYENKKNSFGPAIEKILAVIDKGVSDRRTVNGEVLKLQAETRQVWDALDAEMKDMDATLSAMPDIRNGKPQGLVPHSLDTDGVEPTLGSSPDSPTGRSRRSSGIPGTPDVSASMGSIKSTPSSLSASRRMQGLPVSSRYLSPRSVSGSSTVSTPRTSFSSITPRANSRTGVRATTPASAPPSNKPRWTGSTVVDYNKYGPHKRPERRLYRDQGSARSSIYSTYSSSVPQSPLSRENMASPSPSNRRFSISPARTATTNASASTAGPVEARPRQYKPSALVQERLGISTNKKDDTAASGRTSAAGSRAGSRLAGRASALLTKKPKENDKPKWRV